MTYDELQKLPKKKVNNLIACLHEVAAMLEEDGARVLPHLCDTDDNAGQRLRDAMFECHIGPLNS